MKKYKWLYIIGSIVILIAASAYFLPRLILFLAYSPLLAEEEVPLVENTAKSTTDLKMKNGKYLLAFSELKSHSETDTGAFYVIDEEGRFLSQSVKQDLSEPIGMTTAHGKAYVVNNRSSQRSSIDLKTGEIESINLHKQSSNSFSLYSNDEYVIYDVSGSLNKGQKLVYWQQDQADNKKSFVIPHGFTHSIYIEKDEAYITTADPDAITYIHHIDLKNNKVISSKKLDLDDEEYAHTGLPSNPSLTYYKGYLYYTVNRMKTVSDSDDTIITKGKIIKVDMNTLKIVKKIPVGDKNYNPDSLAVVNNQLVILSGYSGAYVMNEQEQIERITFKLPKAQLAALNQKSTFTEQITVKGKKAYIFTMYDLRNREGSSERGEINAFNLENGEHLSRTVVSMPLSTYLTMTFAVIE